MALLDLCDDHDLDHLHGALQLVDRFDLALDIGAHRGIWTREMKRFFKTVIAFEPVYELYEQIPYPKFQVALGEYPGTCAMQAGDRNTGQNYVTVGEGTPVRPLDQYDFQCVDFIKIDVEGYELKVLKGAEQTIKSWRPHILVEQNGLCERYDLSDDETCDFLEKLGYRPIARWYKDVLYSP